MSFNMKIVIFWFSVLFVITLGHTHQRPSYNEYLQVREKFVETELDRSLGSDIILNDKELQANEIIMAAKLKELDSGFSNPYSFLPSRNIFEVLDEVRETDLFKILEKMPKGAILHSHDTALASADYMVSLTDYPNLWQCNDTTTNLPNFLFSTNEPAPIPNCDWVLVVDEKERIGADVYDYNLRRLFSLYTDYPYKDVNAVWSRFMVMFIVFGPLVTYEPVWKAYFKQALTEFYADGVQYLEFRGVLPGVYNLDGYVFSPVEVVQMYKEISEQFVLDNPGFIGSKFIYAPIKFVTPDGIVEYMNIIKTLTEQFPDYIAGFDLVGQEDPAIPLSGFVEQMLQLPANIKFFLHAGETNWFGTTTDENLIDAVLLGTHRIGHGFALVKHPAVMEVVKEKGIAIEINPISNQVLKLVEDIRNHPAAILMSDNYNVVISSDDPGFWEVSPLTHDYYEAFMAIASRHHDLRLLKRLAMNSLEFSAMCEDEKKIAFAKWNDHWESFINDLIESD